MKDSPRHLAILLPTLQAGGAERTMLKLARGFLEHGYRVDLVLVHNTGPLIAEVPKSVNIVDLHAPRGLSSRALSSLPALIAYLRRDMPGYPVHRVDDQPDRGLGKADRTLSNESRDQRAQYPISRGQTVPRGYPFPLDAALRQIILSLGGQDRGCFPCRGR